MTGKIIYLCVATCVFTGVVFSTINVWQDRNHLIKSKISEGSTNVSIFSESIEGKIDELKSDVEFLSLTPPIEGIVRAFRNNGVDPKDGSSIEIWKERLGVIFREMLYSKPRYTQIRYIGFETGGREIVRVERVGTRVIQTREENLQDKSNEPYFKLAKSIQSGKVFLSPFSFNRELGKLVHPLQLVLRAVRPISETLNKSFGFVIINMDYTGLFRNVGASENQSMARLVVNNEGKILYDSDQLIQVVDGVSPIHSKESENHLIENLLGKKGHITFESNQQSKKTSTIQANGKIFVYQKLFYNDTNPNEYLGVFSVIQLKKLNAFIVEDLTQSGFILLALIVFVAFLSVLISRELVSPIQFLIKITEKLSRGERVSNSKLPIKTNDEIGLLTKTLFDLSTNLSDKSLQLDLHKKALDSAAIVIETDLDGNITYVNEKFIEVSQYAEFELIGTNHRLVKSGEHSYEFFENLWRTISKGRVWKGEIKNRAKDGTFYWVDTTIYPLKGEDKRLQKYLSIQFDITDRKAAEEQMLHATEEARSANKVKSQFLANMSHELRTPLNAIIGYSDMLIEDVGDNSSDLSKDLDKIRSSGKHLLNLINQVLDISKIEAGKMALHHEFFSLNSFIKEIESIVEPLVKENANKFSVDNKSSIDQIYCDRDKLKQILINLVSNSAKFTKNGKVNLSFDFCKIEDVDTFVFEVSDSGMGIPKEKITDIFDEFSQVDESTTRNFQGTGLGLSICRRFITLMGGRIFVESEVDKGSVFKVVLPLNANKNKTNLTTQRIKKVS